MKRVIRARQPPLEEQEVSERLEHDADALAGLTIAEIERLTGENALFLK